MKRDLLIILACPVCKGQLELTAQEETPDEVVRGCLKCAKCRRSYPIQTGVPDLLAEIEPQPGGANPAKQA